MNILFISQTNDGYHLATHLADDGNNVRYWVKEPVFKVVGQGRKNPLPVTSYQPHIGWADMVMFDMVGMGKEADRIRKTGKPVIGAGEIADKIELDREFGQEIMQQVGTKNNYVDIAPFKTFSSIREGVAYLKKEKAPYVFKALNNKDDIWTFVAKETNDGLIEYMESLKQKSFPFLLQQQVKGIEISTEGWHDGFKFIPQFNHTIEKKRLMNGNIGQNTGCQGSVAWVCEEDEIVKSALLPIESILTKHNYQGPVDVNCIVTEDKLYFLEFTARNGYCAIENLWHLIEGDKTGFFYDIARGKPKEVDFSGDYSMAVVLSFPPYPADDKEKLKQIAGMKVLDMTRADSENIWLHDVMWNEKKEPVLAGAIGYIGAVVDTGKTVGQASAKAYKTIEDITLMKEVAYRTDISEGVEDNIKTLGKWGWIDG